MNKKILPRIILVVSVVLFAVYSTNAFFSDTETSTGNTFQAGAIDLKIDNESYYNGEISPNTTWDLDDLTGHLFFDFSDIKPGDWGEDTISLHVNTNDAWACMDLSLTKNDDNDCTGPELINDPNCAVNEDPLDGELGQNINIIFWNDDGDNVLEDDEETSIFRDETVLDLFSSGMWALAQSQQQGRILLDSDLNEQGAMVGGKTYYIAKGWCFGNMSIDPVAQDGDSHTNSPTTNPGFSCDGSQLDNATQTDSIEGDFSFYAEQARHNPDFVCEGRNLLWIIGDIEASQTDNPVDELNYTGVFGVFPTPPAIGADYTRTITAPIDDTADKEFPWNTNYGADYARNINIEYSWAGATIPVKLSIGWSPGKSANEQKDVYLDGSPIGSTPNYLGAPTAGWWNDMPRYVDTFNFNLTNGPHTIRIEHLFGDGTLWDFIKLEKN
jgi:predicted ribosomally synthesized peptide with SipW-like signal peptide